MSTQRNNIISSTRKENQVRRKRTKCISVRMQTKENCTSRSELRPSDGGKALIIVDVIHVIYDIIGLILVSPNADLSHLLPPDVPVDLRGVVFAPIDNRGAHLEPGPSWIERTERIAQPQQTGSRRN